MARIAAAFASSHSVMLTCELEDWIAKFRDRDDRLPFYDRQGNRLSYRQVMDEAPQNAATLVTQEAITQRFHDTQRAMDHMRDEVQSARLDALIICGDDQYELFHDENMPSIAIYYGGSVINGARPAEPDKDWYRRAQQRRGEEGGPVTYSCHAPLALHLIEGLVGKGFDVTAVKSIPPDAHGGVEGHAYSFIHYRYLHNAPVPIVPIFLNTYNPPNQPTPQRCVALGRALAELVASFPGDMRIGIMASGGMSHFRVEEDLDQSVFEAIKRKDLDALGALPPCRLLAGSSEIRNWIVAAAAATHLDVTWTAYIPAYRTLALSGTGLGFARWS
jgi:Catalytic LigB subunit of aromatic ring-opening dioxygenase